MRTLVKMEYRIVVMIKYIAVFSCIVQMCASESQSPLVFTNWPPTKTQTPSFRHQIMMAMRPIMRQPSPEFLYTKRAPPLLPQPQRLVRPMKLGVNAAPYFLLKNHLTSAYKRPTPTPLTSSHNFQSSPPGPNTGEYVFENPFTSNSLQTTSKSPSFQGGSTIRLNADRFNPIHTIPAPNLSQLETFPAWKTKVENEYYEKPHPVFLPQRPNDIHQYQVTEETNDHTINDLVSGTRKLYAPDPDPSLPAFKIKPATDPFSQPSNTNFQTLHLFGTLPPSALIQSPTSSIQFDSSNSPIQQKFFQQQSIVQGMPSVYNPTYLVTQSNQLLDQHKRHLFQPEIRSSKDKSNFIAESSNLDPVQSVASPGQIMTAAKDKMSDISNYEALPSNPSPLIRGKYSASLSESVNPTLTEKEVSDLINFGKLYDNLDQNGFVASSYYDSFPDTPADFDITQQQRDNEEILRQANEDIAAKKVSVTTSPTTVSIVTEHQQRLAEQYENVPLRIIVPETNERTDTSNTNEVKRSDNFSNESNTESESYLELDNQATVSAPNSEYRSEEVWNDDNTESIVSYEYSNDSTEDMVHSS